MGYKSGQLIGAGLLAVGLVIGFAVGFGVRPNAAPAGDIDWSKTPFAQTVEAATAQGFDNFAVATGPVDQGVEAFYFLDFLTGDLRATVLNTRQAEFGAFYEYNIMNDFNAADVKNPKYLMVTGVANIPRGRGNTQIARSVVYITEATTGQMAAFVMPWNSSNQAAGRGQIGTFRKIANVQLRSQFVRDQ
ncbi:MAG: hypothetical protein AAF596_06520 [Planctomycetota bacterium]